MAWLAEHLPSSRLGDRLHPDHARRRPRRHVAAARASRPRPTAARSRPSAASTSRSGCCATSSRRWWRPARWAWATTSPTSASWSTTRRPARYLLLPAGRPRRARNRSRRGRPAARRRGPRIQDFFIEQAFPRREVVDRVLEHLESVGGDGATTQELMAQVNLGRGRIEGLMKVLDVEGAVGRAGTRWIAQPGATWATTPSATRASPSCAGASRRRWPPSAPTGAASCARCRRSSMIRSPQDCGRCAVCTGSRFDGPLDPSLVRDAALHLRARPCSLRSRRWRPTPMGA